MKSSHVVAGLAAAVALCVASVACAQMPGGGARPSGPGTGTGSMLGNRGMPQAGGGDDARMAGANFAELVNMRVAQLEEDLNLVPGQLPLWNAYRDRVIRMLDDQRRGMRVSAAETTAPKRLDALADIARNRLAAVEDIVDAGKALYAVLTPAQREVADRRLALPLATLTGNDSGSDVRAQSPPRSGAAPPK